MSALKMSPEIECPVCNHSFSPSRSNQDYCSRSCQRNGSRTSTEFSDRRRNRLHYELAHDVLYNFTYNTKREDKNRFLTDLLGSAIEGNSKIRNLLTDPRLRHENCRSRPTNVAKLVDTLCWRQLGCSSQDVIRGYVAFDPKRLAVPYADARPIVPPPLPADWDFRDLLIKFRFLRYDRSYD